MDTLLSLKAFLRVAEEGNFTAAASKQGLSRALLSKHIMVLENRLGTRLFHRTTRRLSLTESGRLFYEQTAKAIDEVCEAMSALAEMGIEPRGVLRINSAHGFGRRYISPVIGRYLSQHPELKIDLTLDDQNTDIVAEGYDVAIRVGPLQDSRLIARKLTDTQLLVCAAPHYLAEHGTPRIPQELAGHNCIKFAYARASHCWAFSQQGQHLAVPVEGNLQVNDGDTLIQLAVDGYGLIIVPTFACCPELLAKRLMPLLLDWDTWTIGIYAVYPSRKHLSANVRSFVDFLVGHFSGTPVWEQWRDEL